MMAARKHTGKTRTLVVVAETQEIRQAFRRSVGTDGHHVLECRLGDLPALIRSVQVDVVAVLGESSELLVAQARDIIERTDDRLPRISVVVSESEALQVLLDARDDV
jgi:hypothetical protein